MFSSLLGLALPRFLWRGRWFWGAWLLVFLLPFTRHEARLHFIGSRFFSDLYDQPWQKRWMNSDDWTPGTLSPLEAALFKNVSGGDFYSFYYSSNVNPAGTSAGQLFKRFPQEKWLHALALRQILGRSSLGNQVRLRKWALDGERLDPTNAFYPLVLSKAFGESSFKNHVGLSEEALQRAARCRRIDDGSLTFRQVMLRIAPKTGLETWTEKSKFYLDRYQNMSSFAWHYEGLLSQCINRSCTDLSTFNATNNPVYSRALLKRSAAVLRIALLMQSAPCDSTMWKIGAEWARGAWGSDKVNNVKGLAPPPTDASFAAFARSLQTPPDTSLIRQCLDLSSRNAMRVRLLDGKWGMHEGFLGEGPVFSPLESLWAMAGHAIGWGILGFAAYLLGWWWLISMFCWRVKAQPSSSRARVVPSGVTIALTLALFGTMVAIGNSWLNSSLLVRGGPPIGQVEVFAAIGIFAFLAPPLFLALWCGVRTYRQHRAAFELPARAQMEMGLQPFDVFVLARATGAFALVLLAFSVGFSLLWGFLIWQGKTGCDWLRYFFPGISTRVIDPDLTSLDSPIMPIYSGLCVITLTALWFFAWRYATDRERRPIFHQGILAWKDTLGCLLTWSVWVYLAFLVFCHFTGVAFEHRLELATQHGEGIFVKGF